MAFKIKRRVTPLDENQKIDKKKKKIPKIKYNKKKYNK